MSSLFIGPDAQPRCRWCGTAPEFLGYHDHEWGFPVADDRRLFEKISLEAFQSGLSWRTILAKREHFREAFAQFDVAQLKAMGFDVTSVNDKDKDYVEVEVVKGTHSYEVQIDVDDKTGKAEKIDVTTNLWETEATEAALKRNGG